MNRVLILVEGLTEETFVGEILKPHLENRGVVPIPALAVTKRVKSGPNFKGGIVSYGKIKNDIKRLLNDTSAVAVTTMIDFYGLPSDFPGYHTMPKQDSYAKVAHLEKAFGKDIDHHKFFPYLQLHEFEALIFVAPEKIATYFPNTNKLNELRQIKSTFHSPEEIDDGPETAPSKRLKSLFPSYEKNLYGPLATLEIGLAEICRECAHFRGWLEWLETLG
ncbi:MAG: hypothetical protein BroJett011_29850 [Chloroflexota bacterium]|nr:MAG: hypothetical protein BroJett011_29850 [Chloroflexota bacterium]